MSEHKIQGVLEVITDPSQFDHRAGNLLERMVFNNRIWVMLLCTVVTLFSIFQLRTLDVSASFEKMLPQSHPYIANYLDNRDQLRGLGDAVRLVVENRNGEIFEPEFLNTFSKINDEVFLIPGVDRAWMKSIWTPVVRWTEVTEEGFIGGPVMPSDYNGSQQTIDELKLNINRAGVVGSLVANDLRSSMMVIPLRGLNGNAVDYQTVSNTLEEIRQRYENDNVKIHIIGFAKLSGDLIAGLQQVMVFFLVAAVIAALIIFSFNRCVRSTLLVLACSLVAVIWQLGFVSAMGKPLDPFSVLVPFLVFAIGVSHGAQKMNGIMQDIGRGTHRLVAARYTFRRLFIAGLTALLADVVGFAVLVIIDIPVIRELALSASIGVAVLIFTNLILLPVLLSYTGVSVSAAKRSLQDEERENSGAGLGGIWRLLDRFTTRGYAIFATVVGVLLAVYGVNESFKLQVGDLDAGAPELRADSRYNQDNAYITSHYGVSSDVFAVMVKTPDDQCSTYETLRVVDELAWTLAQVPGVQQTSSLTDTVRSYTAGSYEGNPKWLALSDNKGVIDPQVNNAMNWNSEFLNVECSMTPVLAYLADHKADTLARVVEAAEKFAAEHSTEDRQILLAAGSAGVEAATNIVVREANRIMLLCVYAAVALLCAIAFRSWRAVVVAVLPLMLTSILAEALMVQLGIGMKVATLPVIALGVGIGVDYALYLLSIQLTQQRAGLSLAQAYRKALQFTGKVVGLVGVTLAAGVVTWAWSPIKFQADMGILLTFMFLWNMLGALVLIPALSHFLLNDRQPAAKGTGAVA